MKNDRAVQIAHFLLRVVAGLLVFQPGALKVFGWYGGTPPNGGTSPAMSQAWIGGWIEVVGGLMLILGLFTRPMAFILSGEMAVAYFQFHQPKGTWPVQNQGAPAVLLCFIFLYLATTGGGEWGLDTIIRNKRKGSS